MPWFKVDDTFPHHAKVLAAGNASTGLWVRAGAWSMQQLTDGFVPDHVARTMGTPSEAKRLVDAGLWVRVDGGYQFHQWTDVQRTKDQVLTDRHAATERQRHARETAKSRRESRRDTGVSHGPPDQTRPDQTNKDSGSDFAEEHAATPPPTNRKKAAKPLADDWRPTQDHLTRCGDIGIDPGTELAKFRAHAEANDRRQVNWNAAFTQWLLSARPSSNVRPIRATTDAQGQVVLPPLPKGVFEQ